MRALPPLNPLRAFAAAARHESFNRAAEELHVTPSAISHQIRSLEEHLGLELFRRHPRAVSLTAAGREFLPPVAESLERIGDAARRLMHDPRERVLTLSAAPAFATGWLIPRLVDFHTVEPEIEVRLDTSLDLIRFTDTDFDAAIRYSADPGARGLVTHCLFREQLIVVCSPTAAARIRQPDDLCHQTLLHTQSRLGAWRTWAAAMGVEELDTSRGQRLANETLSLEAAATGLGVALVERHVAERAIAQGRLAAPFPPDCAGRSGYYLVYPETAAEQPRLARFRDWLLATVAEADEGAEPVAVAGA